MSKDGGTKHSQEDWLQRWGLLGRDDPGLVEQLQVGLSTKHVDIIAELLQLSRQELSEVLWIRPATLTRRRREGRLSVAEGERLYRVAETLAAVIKMVSGDTRAAGRWFRTPVWAFSWKTPLEVLMEPLGVDKVRDQAYRVMHGVYY